MFIKWTSCCSRCEAPLSPCIKTYVKANKRFIKWYRRIRPIFMDNNHKMYSFTGLKLERVCYSCFIQKPKITPNLLKLREMGQIRHMLPRSRAKSEEELLMWFGGLLRCARKFNLNINS